MRQGGLLDKWLDEISAPGCEAFDPPASSSGEEEVSGVTHFLATFLILGLGLSCALLVLALEILVAKSRSRLKDAH